MDENRSFILIWAFLLVIFMVFVVAGLQGGNSNTPEEEKIEKEFAITARDYKAEEVKVKYQGKETVHVDITLAFRSNESLVGMYTIKDLTFEPSTDQVLEYHTTICTEDLQEVALYEVNYKYIQEPLENTYHTSTFSSKRETEDGWKLDERNGNFIFHYHVQPEIRSIIVDIDRLFNNYSSIEYQLEFLKDDVVIGESKVLRDEETVINAADYPLGITRVRLKYLNPPDTHGNSYLVEEKDQGLLITTSLADIPNVEKVSVTNTMEKSKNKVVTIQFYKNNGELCGESKLNVKLAGFQKEVYYVDKPETVNNSDKIVCKVEEAVS